MSPDPLRLTVISAEHRDHLPEFPIVSRSELRDYESTVAPIAYLDELQNDSDFWTSEWGLNLLARLNDASIENQVCYVVPGHPMLGDATMQFLLGEDSAGRIDLELYDEPLPVVLTEVLAIGQAPPAFVDALTLMDVARSAPFESGRLPVSSNQSTVITNVVPGANGAFIAEILASRYRASTEVRLIPMHGDPEQSLIPLSELGQEATHYPCYLVLPLAREDRFQKTPDDLQRIVARLRAPDGCPWDRQQTNVSLGRNLIEESYELLEAIEANDHNAMREEMGDFLLQAYLHCQITRESHAFSLEDVIQTLIDKLVRRHPHVFAQGIANDADAVVRTWDEIKREERAAHPEDKKASPLGDIPASLPALMRLQSVIKRANRSEFATERVLEFQASANLAVKDEQERLLVDQLVHLVTAAQEQGIDTEAAARAWTQAFERAVAAFSASEAKAH
ncbi:MAG: MazG family protein [Thermomicrobiaceae bacterium]